MKASGMDTDGLPELAPQVPTAGPHARRLPPDRRAVRDQRRRARRSRRLYALGGLVVLAAFLVATIVVVDMVR